MERKRLSEVKFDDLPEACLAEIMHRVSVTPMLTWRSKCSLHSLQPVMNPLQCTLVCKKWRSITERSMRSLELSERSLDLKDLRLERFMNVTEITLKWSNVPRSQSRDPLLGLDTLAPRLETMTLLSPICKLSVGPFCRILKSATRLQNLTVSIPHRVAWSRRSTRVTKADALLFLHVVCCLPLLAKLKIACYGTHLAFFLGEMFKDGMPELRDLQLETNVIPFQLGDRILSVLRSFNWVNSSSRQPVAIGHLTGLETLTVRYPQFLTRLETRLPESLSCLLRLTKLKVRTIMAVTLPESLGQLTNLQVLSVTDCGWVNLPQAVLELRALRILELDFCSDVPDLSHLTNLEELYLGDTQLSCPATIGPLRSLRTLRLVSCYFLTNSLECLGNLTALENLEIRCDLLRALPESVGQLTRLAVCKLDIPMCQALPESIGRWRSLEFLLLNCKRVTLLPDSLCDLGGSLKHLLLSRFRSLRTLPSDIGRLSALKRLQVHGCPLLTILPDSLGVLSKLEVLTFSDCKHLVRLPGSVVQLGTLKELHLLNCTRLEKLPLGLVQLPRLERLLCRSSVLPKKADFGGVWCAPSYVHSTGEDS